MCFAASKPIEIELTKMRNLLEENLKQDAFGLSSGLEYAPSGFADVNEFAELYKVVAEMGRVYTTHMRDKEDFLEKSINESLTVSRKSKAKLEMYHLKATRREN